MQVLGIETSCDETAAAVVRTGKEICSNVVVSQVDLHRVFGGIVPEVASRKHVEMISVVIERALTQAQANWSDIDVIAVTHGPGLVGSLLVGVCAAKGLALAQHKPLVGVNHLEGHLYSNFLAAEPPPFPFICLIVSGGHTDLVEVRGHGKYRLLGRTRDDAAGESFDKVARALGLEYPGGPAIDRVARSGNPAAFDFPRAWLPDSLDFSFSGLKTAVVRTLPTLDPAAREEWVADVAASFQQSIVDVLVEKTWQAAAARGIRHVAVCGGVAGNSALRAAFQDRATAEGGKVSQPPLFLCTDNAAMIACAGYFRYQTTGPSGLDLDVASVLPLDSS